MKPQKPPRAKIKPMTPGVPHSARLRAYLAGAVVTVGLCGIAWRAWALQIDDGAHYRELADRQHAMTVDIPAPRGDVTDAHGRPLAVSADADSIWANPRDIRDVTDTADKLAKLMGGDAGALEAKLGGDRRFVWIDRHVTPKVAKAVREAKLPGIEVAKEPRRWYPGRAIGGPVIGRADIDGKGLEGIELSMDAVLHGERGEGQAVRDARGKKMFADGLAQPESGATVQLSLDRSIQAIADAAVTEAVISNKAKNGVVVVLDVATSRVIAMASYPTYDPNSGEGHAAARNRPVTDVYEAGSVMKVFSVAAAVEDGVVSPDTEFDLQGGQLKVGPKTIRDVHFDPYLTVSGIIKRSSNVGAAKIALRLGGEKLYAGLKKFGFGMRTGIELPGEQVGTLRDGARWRDIELATISFGYGLTVTPLQIAAGLAALGNHGLYQEPRIVERVTDADGTVLYEAAPAQHQAVSAKTADAMIAMLASVFEGGKQNGTASQIVVPGFRCGGKTGTAHKYDPETKQYAPDRYLSSFAGLAPIDHPRLAIVVMIDEPSGGDYYGGKVAGPVFATVASEALRYLGVPGDTLLCPPLIPGALPGIAPKTCTVASPLPVKPAPGAPTLPLAPIAADHQAGVTAAPRAADHAAAPTVAPSAADHPAAPTAATTVAPAAADHPAAPTAAPSAAGHPAAPTAATLTVPDFRGMGLGHALDVARKAHLALEVSGSGRVIDQDPAPGPAATTARVTLRFSDGNSVAAGPAPAAP